jgi:hypothetical protein
VAAGIRLNVTPTCQDNVSCINGAPQNVDPDYFITVAIYKAEDVRYDDPGVRVV